VPGLADGAVDGFAVVGAAEDGLTVGDAVVVGDALVGAAEDG
jgi:hypothetical protein